MGESNGSIYALMVTATTLVLSWSVVQPIYSLYVLDVGANVVQLGLILSLRQFIPLVFRFPLRMVRGVG